MNNTHEIFVREPYFSYIADGQKTIEGRIASHQFRQIQTGDVIEFANPRSSARAATLVTGSQIYPGFREMLEQEDLNSLLPDCETVAEGLDIYHSFPRFKQRARKSGVIAVHFEVFDR